MRIIDCIQGSDEWFEARLGKVTGTGFQKVLAKGAGKTRRSYMMQVAAERLSGLAQEHYSNEVMQRGSEVEPVAVSRYEAITGVSVLRVGFAQLDDNTGCSPDGLVNEDGMIEVKCPNTTTHIETILKNKIPTQYKAQIQGGMWVCDRQWTDFISFDPRMQDCQIWVIRVERDQAYIDNLKKEVDRFVEELVELTDKIKSFSAF